jgi:CheY-like chemotaxis protein
MRGLLGLSRGTGGSARVFDLGTLVKRVAGMLKHSRPGIEVTCEVSDEPLGVLGEEDALLQALLNLGTNGLEAMTRGTLTLRCLAKDGQALVEVQDEGVGMDEGQQRLIFEPLFTTKSAQGGSGLGLTIVQQTLRAFGGSIQFESALGRGTTVRVLLPTVQIPHRVGVPVSPSHRLLTSRVLLVDDDEQVRSSTKRALEAAGATVLAYGSPALVLEEVADAQLAFDVALLDVNMPEFSGPELAARLREKRGPIPVVLVTGATGDLIPESESSRREVRVLRKPWSRDDLIGSIAEVLGSAG